MRTTRRKLSAAAWTLALLTLSLWSPGAALAQWTTSGSNINNTNAGNVGVGTTTPNAKLVVASGDFGLGTNNLAPWTAQTSVIESLDTSIFFGTDTDLGLNSNAYHGNGWKYKTADPASNIHLYKGSIYFRTAPAGAAGAALTWTDAMFINSGGNVGVGTTDPTGKLVVKGPPISAGYPVQLNVLDNSPLAADVGGAIGFGGKYAGADDAVYAIVRGAKENSTSGNTDGYLSLRTRSGATAAEKVRITSAGNVGIGTAAPSQKLDVAGSANVSQNLTVAGTVSGGVIQAKYQDVAEWVPSAQRLAAGTVVVLDAARVNHVAASAKAYDTKVAGVVSARPGVLLGEGGEGKVAVATTGRVRVKVNADRAPIEVGDLLVTSEVEGVAMKSLPLDFGGTPVHRPGTIIGKALEPLARGTGEILVLLSLQ